MSFPWHNRPWREAAEFLAASTKPRERILAPDQFWSIVSRVERYVPANVTPAISSAPEFAYDWIVLDLHDMAQIPRAFLESVDARMMPVFANDHFVIWTADDPREPDPSLHDHLEAFRTRLDQLDPEPSEPNQHVMDRALGDSPSLMRLADLSDTDLRAAMDTLHGTTGYLYPTLRDKGYQEDIAQQVSALLRRWSGGRVLELAAGGQPFIDVPDKTLLVRTELSEVGIHRARDADQSRAGFVHAAMDAQRIAFPDATFDAVVFTDSIEHVRDASLVFREAARVLVPEGELLLTFANSNSVNQVLSEKLGYPRFVTNHQHIREFNLEEIRELLQAARLDIFETAGFSLYPYWGVPGVDEVVREITDDDPEFVAMMRELGRRAGAEYAYVGVVFARKRSDSPSDG